MSALSPGACVGIMGGGQLGRMLCMACARLGLKTHIYTDIAGPACDVANTTTIGAFDDVGRVRGFAGSVDVITFEFENVPVAAVRAAEDIVPVRPGAKALEISQDRGVEKDFISSLGLPVAQYQLVGSPEQLIAGFNKLKAPAILKTARLGYDGKGQVRIDSQPDPQRARAILDEVANVPCVLEAHVEFEYEVSLILVRGLDGQILFYDIPLNTHRDGILDTSSVPCNLSAGEADKAREIARTIANALDYVGILGVEMFYLGTDKEEPLVVNEFAPRVHNSGHWTLDACAVSQFENHIRAIAGWPLGDIRRHSDAVMTNLIGHDVDDWQKIAHESQCCVHIYGKPETRPGRKMGHVTRLSRRQDDEQS